MTKCDVMPQQKRPMDPMAVAPAGQTSRVRRVLFGDRPDRDQTSDFVQNELNIQMQNDMKKWNFDFINEKPLNGRYQWMKVAADGDLERPVNGHGSSQQETCHSNTNGSCDGVVKQNGQTHITDFMRKRKHVQTTQSSSSALSPSDKSRTSQELTVTEPASS